MKKNFQKKFNVGRVVRSLCVIGGGDFDSNEFFSQSFFFRNRKKCLCLQECVKVGSKIITDCLV